MDWQYIYLIIIYIAVVVSLGIAVYAWAHRDRTGVLAFAGTMLAVSEWLLTSALVSTSRDAEQARFWVNPRYFGLTAMLAFFITFAIQYTGRGKWLTRGRQAIIFSIPVLTQIIIETNPLHHWFLVRVEFSRDGILMGLDSVVYGPLFWVHTVYSYALVLIGIALIVQRSVRTFSLYREQAALMILGILPPLVTSVIDAFLLVPGLKHPLAPLGFAFMGMAFAWAMFRHRMLDIVPVARDSVIENMSDGMLVLDASGNVVDINPSARGFLGLEASQIIGKPAAELFAAWSEQTGDYLHAATSQAEVVSEVQGQKRYFDLRISPLDGDGKNPQGRIIILRDITSRKQAENRLQDTFDTVKALQEQLYQQAIRDPLTGLYNRRFFDETIPREMERAVREAYPLSFVMMDLDHFKRVNDTYGHAVGDLVLQHVATMLAEQTRASDYTFRYGGEEFLAVLPGTHPKAAFRFAERWRLHLQDDSMPYGGEIIPVSMSIGIAAILPGGEAPADVLVAADNAMYRAKARGRNCVEMYKPYA